MTATDTEGDTRTEGATAVSPPPTPSPERPGLEAVTREIRFAVVMYGGVSLAIYINGVAQELLRLVRSTSGRIDEEGMPKGPRPLSELNGTERVYRKLATLLSDPAKRREHRAWAQAPRERPDPLDGAAEDARPLDTRFVVDVLSGTSAGGINAVFLAKALAGDRSMDELAKLWISEGDLDVLINDRRSYRGTGLARGGKPASLLNGRRMYAKLLAALDGMDDAPAKPGSEEPRPDGKAVSPHVDELDLFVTNTDVRGAVVPIRLFDRVVHERRHRNVLHFRYAAPGSGTPARDDFTRRHNPLLAFAARCTSSFPFAFEPMSARDVDEILSALPYDPDHDAARSSEAIWADLLAVPDDPGHDPRLRSYADGGYLDNKPFGHAVEALANRDDPVRVERKLVYIEPSPEHPEHEPHRTAPPDALENVGAALVRIPRYETIREDIQAVLRRNRRIERVSRLTWLIERDLEAARNEGRAARPAVGPDEWDDLPMSEMARRYGRYYLPYRRLRIAAVTDDFARIVANVGGWRSEDEIAAVRAVARAWRETHYADEPGPPPRKPSVNQFLNEFDVAYRHRRLTFVRRKLDEIVGALERAALHLGATEHPSAADRVLLRDLADHGLVLAALGPDDARELLTALLRLKRELALAHRDLRGFSSRVADRDRPMPELAGLRKKIAELGIGREHVLYLLGGPSAWSGSAKQKSNAPRGDADDVADERAREMLASPARFGLPADLVRRLDEAAAVLRDLVASEVRHGASARCRDLLDARRPLRSGDAVLNAALEQLVPVRRFLFRYYDEYEEYDQISFPVLYDTSTGELATVDVIRISPEDAVGLIDVGARGEQRRKLAGTALGNFGAFLDRAWRKNDLMWGRLDAAERLVATLLPGEEDAPSREALTREAQRLVLAEAMGTEARAELGALLARALLGAAHERDRDSARKQALQKVMEQVGGAGGDGRLEKLLCGAFTEDELVSYVKTSYEVDRELDPVRTLRTFARATDVVGQVLDRISEDRSTSLKVRWISRGARFLAAVATVAAPRSFFALLFSHALELVYTFELLLILAGHFLASTQVERTGWTALVATAALHVAVLVAGDRLRNQRRWARVLAGAVVAAVLVLAAVGFDRLAGTGVVDGLLGAAGPG